MISRVAYKTNVPSSYIDISNIYYLYDIGLILGSIKYHIVHIERKIKMRKYKNSIEKEISKNIVLAQVASDKGKGIESIEIKGSRGARDLGYGLKVNYIMTALKLIRKNKTQFSYWVESAPDQNGYGSVIVYFEYILWGEKLQVSFHTPESLVPREMWKLVNTGRPTVWNGIIGGSRTCCEKLKEVFDL